MDTGSADDYYALLGIDAEADAAELRRAWRRLALRWHPDRAGPGATASFRSSWPRTRCCPTPARGPCTIGGEEQPRAARRGAPARPTSAPPPPRA